MNKIERKFLSSYNKMMKDFKDLLFAQRDADVALSIARVYGELRWHNDDGIYADKEVEHFVISLVKKGPSLKLPKQKEKGKNGAVLLVSELYDYGGHTKVALQWLETMSSVQKHKLIVTRHITKRCKNQVEECNIPLYECRNSGINAINEIVNFAIEAEFVVLLIHPDDIIATVAAKLLSEFGADIVFYNHADHAFSYGIDLADVVCEIGEFGESISKRTGRVRGKSFRLGIPISTKYACNDITQYNRKYYNKNKDKHIVISCGSSWKYEPARGLFFGDFIDSLLANRSDIEIVIVGPTGREPWWRNKIKEWGNHVHFMGTVPYEELDNLLKYADVYVDSYPINGGTAFPEALVSGLPCTGLSSPTEGYSYADELRVDTVEMLVKRVLALTKNDKNEMIMVENIRQKVINSQSENVFKKRVEKIYSHEIEKTNGCYELNTNEKIDSHFLEKEWRNKVRINLPSSLSLSKLPLSLRIKCLGIMCKVFPYCKTADAIKIIIAALIGNNFYYAKLLYDKIRYKR